jgi:hypothetical protein
MRWPGSSLNFAAASMFITLRIAWLESACCGRSKTPMKAGIKAQNKAQALFAILSILA